MSKIIVSSFIYVCLSAYSHFEWDLRVLMRGSQASHTISHKLCFMPLYRYEVMRDYFFFLRFFLSSFIIRFRMCMFCVFVSVNETPNHNIYKLIARTNASDFTEMSFCFLSVPFSYPSILLWMTICLIHNKWIHVLIHRQTTADRGISLTHFILCEHNLVCIQ